MKKTTNIEEYLGVNHNKTSTFSNLPAIAGFLSSLTRKNQAEETRQISLSADPDKYYTQIIPCVSL